MPISAEQWRASVGAANASLRPYQLKKKRPCWEVFLCLVAALVIAMLLLKGDVRGAGSRKYVSRVRYSDGTGRELVPSLLTTPQRRFLLV